MADPILISKSHKETEWDCRRKEYLAYWFGGTGLRGVAPSFDYDFGSVIHQALARIAETAGAQLDVIGTLAPNARERIIKVCQNCGMDDAPARQWGAIGEGLLRAFYKRQWPAILREYEVIAVEPACATDLGDDVWFIARPDLILRHRLTGGYWYWEYKTTGWTDAKWINQWTKAIQVHSGMQAAAATLGITFDGCIVQGLYKGRKDYYNQIQSSPFAYGWINHGVPGVLPDQTSYTAMRGKGWERFQTWNLVDGLGPWVEGMPEDLLDQQFVRTPPITLRDDLVTDFFCQVQHRVREVREARSHLAQVTTPEGVKAVLNKYFPQSFRACTPAMGSPCGFNDVCWQSWVEKDPLGSGQYARRTLDHQKDFISLLELRKQLKEAA